MTPPTEHRAGADRWMVSYADFVTLLFAFFTTLYAASLSDPQSLAPLTSSLQQAFSVSEPEQPDRNDRQPLRSPDDDRLYRTLANALQGAIFAGQVELIRDARGIVVSLPDDATFPVGSADLAAEARAVIAAIGDAVRSVPNGIRIEGHTDNVPIRTSRYQSNWELSTARASSVVAFLVRDVGIAADRLSAAGYGEFHPRVPNDSESTRARNRRVDLVVLETTNRTEPSGSDDVRP